MCWGEGSAYLRGGPDVQGRLVEDFQGADRALLAESSLERLLRPHPRTDPARAALGCPLALAQSGLVDCVRWANAGWGAYVIWVSAQRFTHQGLDWTGRHRLVHHLVISELDSKTLKNNSLDSICCLEREKKREHSKHFVMYYRNFF